MARVLARVKMAEQNLTKSAINKYWGLGILSKKIFNV